MKVLFALIFIIIPAFCSDEDLFLFSPKKLAEVCKVTEKFNLINERTAPLNLESKEIIASCFNDIMNCQLREEQKHWENTFLVNHGWKIIVSLSVTLTISVTISIRQYFVIKNSQKQNLSVNQKQVIEVKESSKDLEGGENKEIKDKATK
uniref:Uncharacterized protein n=1 Tax=Panagrolaimus davidi TaxID=227884 RepID=A0A914PYE3_9BILA